MKGSPAEKQDIKAGDIVVRIDGKKVTSFLDYFVKMIDKEVGQPIKVDYVKTAEPKNIYTAKLEMTARPLPDGKKLVEEYFQLQVMELTDDTARQYGFDRAYPVLIVTGVDESGTAGQAGISAGDIVLAINGANVSNTKELSLAMEKISEGDKVGLRILRVKQQGMMTMQRQYDVELKAGHGGGKIKSKKHPKKSDGEERLPEAICRI